MQRIVAEARASRGKCAENACNETIICRIVVRLLPICLDRYVVGAPARASYLRRSTGCGGCLGDAPHLQRISRAECDHTASRPVTALEARPQTAPLFWRSLDGRDANHRGWKSLRSN